MDIKEALSQLDGLDDAQWTQDGAPKTEVVSELVGRKVSRAEIVEAAPKFSRENMEIELEPAKEPEPEPAVEDKNEVDTGLLEDLLNDGIPLERDFVDNYLRKMDVRLLEPTEQVLLQQMAELDKRMSEVEEMRRRVKMNLAHTRAFIKALIPDMSNQEAIQAYIRKSNENRAAKKAALESILGGAKLGDVMKLDPRAAIDRAFARKNARGAQRPVR